jgi:DNA gyrase subunit A
MEVNERNGRIVATFPVGHNEDVMLVSDGGQVIRTPVEQISIKGRRTQGVTLFKVAPDESVVSVARIGEDAASGEDGVNGNDLDEPAATDFDTDAPPLQ